MEEHVTTAPHASRTYPLDNLTYDLLTIIQEKSQALEAYDKYQHDAGSDETIGQLFQQIRQQDEQAIGQLVQHLARRLSQSSGASSPSSDQSSGTVLSEEETLTGHVLGEESASSDLDTASGTPA